MMRRTDSCTLMGSMIGDIETRSVLPDALAGNKDEDLDGFAFTSNSLLI